MALNKMSGIDTKLVEKAYVGMKNHISSKKKERLAKKEMKAYDKYSEARSEGSKKTGKLYDKLVNKQTKSIKAGVNVKYK